MLGIRAESSRLDSQQLNKLFEIIDKSKSQLTSLSLLNNNLPKNSNGGRRQPNNVKNYCNYCNKCLNYLIEEVNIKFCFVQNKVNSTKHSKKETCIQNKREINKTLNKNLLGSISRLSSFGCLETNNEKKEICWCQADNEYFFNKFIISIN
uniref:Uncharacterized protein n=1 Tax=Meloidogyne floridensis TaxID=298350 RepID=A0A915NI55_9BILA